MSPMPTTVRRAFDTEMDAARNHPTGPARWAAAERAHILSQPWPWPHTRVHGRMLRLALAERNRREALGQLVRLAVAAPGSATGRYPVGNTGRADVGLTEPIARARRPTSTPRHRSRPNPMTPNRTPTITRRHVLGLGAAAAGTLLLGCASDSNTTSKPPPGDDSGGWAGTLLDPPFEKPDVTLTNLDGTPFPFREATDGKLTVLFFGFTSCPDICPLFLSSIARGREMIDGPGSNPQVLFVGVDTARDTPEVMTTYLANIDDTFTGLTGTPEAINDAIAALKMEPVQIGEPDAEGNYDVGHPARIYVFSPDNTAHRLYRHDVTPRQWARDLPILAAGEWI